MEASPFQSDYRQGPQVQEIYTYPAGTLECAAKILNLLGETVSSSSSHSRTRSHPVSSSLPSSLNIGNVHFGDHVENNGWFSSASINKTETVAVEKKDKAKEKEEKKESQVFAGIVFTVLLFAGSYFMGKSIAENEQANELLGHLDTLRFKLNGYGELLRLGESVAVARKKTAFRSLVLRVGFVAAGAIGLAGAFFASSATVTACAATVVCLGALSLAKFSYEVATKRERSRQEEDFKSRLSELVRSGEEEPAVQSFGPGGYSIGVIPSAPPASW